MVGTGQDLALKLDYATKEPGVYPVVLVTYEIVCSAGNGDLGRAAASRSSATPPPMVRRAWRNSVRRRCLQRSRPRSSLQRRRSVADISCDRSRDRVVTALPPLQSSGRGPSPAGRPGAVPPICRLQLDLSAFPARSVTMSSMTIGDPPAGHTPVEETWPTRQMCIEMRPDRCD